MKVEFEQVLVRAAQDSTALDQLVANVPAGSWENVAGDGWNGRQILTHLADTELVFGYRLRTAIATPGQPVTAFDQDAWAASVPASGVPLILLAATFTSLRNQHIAILQALPEGLWQRTVVHPDYGPQSVATLAGIFLPHSAEHLVQLEAMLPTG